MTDSNRGKGYKRCRYCGKATWNGPQGHCACPPKLLRENRRLRACLTAYVFNTVMEHHEWKAIEAEARELIDR